jgi:hypothetical protein
MRDLQEVKSGFAGRSVYRSTFASRINSANSDNHPMLPFSKALCCHLNHISNNG